MVISADIKNLSIALEALSRIPDSGTLADGIRFELSELVKELARKRCIVQTARAKAAESTQDDVLDDEVPF